MPQEVRPTRPRRPVEGLAGEVRRAEPARVALQERARAGDREAAGALQQAYRCRVWTSAECHAETQRRRGDLAGRV